MSTGERCSAFVGVLLIGIAAFLVQTDRKRQRERNREYAPPVEDLGEQLKEAWAGHHNA